jgi:hypothetical protein
MMSKLMLIRLISWSLFIGGCLLFLTTDSRLPIHQIGLLLGVSGGAVMVEARRRGIK